MLEKQRLLNTYVNNVTLDETLDEIDGFIRERKKSYIVKINKHKYYTAHGCIFENIGKKKIGKEITVYKNEKYDHEVFKTNDYRIEF